jgi:hypothetical protein
MTSIGYVKVGYCPPAFGDPLADHQYLFKSLHIFLGKLVSHCTPFFLSQPRAVPSSRESVGFLSSPGLEEGSRRRPKQHLEFAPAAPPSSTALSLKVPEASAPSVGARRTPTNDLLPPYASAYAACYRYHYCLLPPGKGFELTNLAGGKFLI